MNQHPAANKSWARAMPQGAFNLGCFAWCNSLCFGRYPPKERPVLLRPVFPRVFAEGLGQIASGSEALQSSGKDAHPSTHTRTS
eukprot:6466787-Amphidinium_carterae.1